MKHEKQIKFLKILSESKYRVDTELGIIERFKRKDKSWHKVEVSPSWEPNIKKFPETKEEVMLFEKWYPLEVPLSKEDAANMKAKLFNELWNEDCGGAKCTNENCPVCKNEMY